MQPKINNRLPVTLACGRSYVGIFCKKDISGINLFKGWGVVVENNIVGAETTPTDTIVVKVAPKGEVGLG